MSETRGSDTGRQVQTLYHNHSSLLFDMSSLLKTRALVSTRDLFLQVRMKNLVKTSVCVSDGFYLPQYLPDGGVQWLLVKSGPPPSGDARGYVIAMAIKMASFVGVFVDCCWFSCCPGGRWGNTERVVAQWWHPVASGVALDMPHWAMPSVLLRRTTVAIKTASG
jgi:hypothetical protein